MEESHVTDPTIGGLVHQRAYLCINRAYCSLDIMGVRILAHGSW